MGTKSIDVDLSDVSQTKPEIKGNRLVPIPVAGGSSGMGLPYAPEDWPCPGDLWRWKVGTRKCISGHWIDRSICAPPSCPKSRGKKPVFQSKLSLEEYIRKEFPQVDVDSFFSSFIWRVPSVDFSDSRGAEINNYISSSSIVKDEHSESRLEDQSGDCKAGNKMCSLQSKEKNNILTAKDCNICCSEAGFCRNCCCILCCNTVDSACGSCTFIRCEANLDNRYICGHVAHVECALRAYMAGTVGGSIGLDTEYYCRRCDNKTNLIPFLTKLIKACESLDSNEDIEKLLKLGFCILRGSKQPRAKSLQNRIGVAINQLKHGVLHLDGILQEDNATSPPAGKLYNNGHDTPVSATVEETENDHINKAGPLQGLEANDERTKKPVYITSESDKISEKLESEIDQVLRELRRSQQLEYRKAEQKLYVQKDFLLSLYQQLDYERSELTDPAPLPIRGHSDVLLSNVLHRVDQIKYEEEKLRKMLKVADGFGRTPKNILADCYELVIGD
ncbi:protein OBERON 2-like isoform X1 [Zingiber officinale]|uniref:protein OBERON 2-like isoform X1 n=1 Tax=Zingiber officinale TaxID=94328 RepID=UPI001C4BEC9A|nr:protein OBERON 2-like isoform X1 [Zingiber officinale]